MPVYREPTRNRRRRGNRPRPKRHAVSSLTSLLHTSGAGGRTRRQARRRTRRSEIRSTAQALNIPTTQFGMRTPTSVLRSQIPAAAKTLREVDRTTRQYEEENQPPGIVERGLLGSLIYETTGTDISDEARRAIYGTENPSLGDIALNVGLAAVPGVAGVAGRRCSRVVVRQRPRAQRSRQRELWRRAGSRRRQAAPPAPSRRGSRAGRRRSRARWQSFPIRRPIKTTKYSVYAQAPAAITNQDPGELAKPFTGQGVVADVLGPVSETLGGLAPGEVAENFAKDVIDLPANTPPAIYMPLAGVKEAIFNDDPSRLEGLVEDYTEHGLIPNLVSGDFAARKGREGTSAIRRARGSRGAGGHRARHGHRRPLRRAGPRMNRPARRSARISGYAARKCSRSGATPGT